MCPHAAALYMNQPEDKHVTGQSMLAACMNMHGPLHKAEEIYLNSVVYLANYIVNSLHIVQLICKARHLVNTALTLLSYTIP
jgi:hypothetical protein